MRIAGLIGGGMVLAVVAFTAACGQRPDTPGSGIPATFGGEPVTLGVCVSATGGGGDRLRHLEEGIRTAHEAFRESTGRKVVLSFRRAAAGPAGLENAVRECLEKDGAAGLILCGTEEEVLFAQDPKTACSIPTVIVGPWDGVDPDGGTKACGVRLSRPRALVARACAMFMARTLKAGRVGLVIGSKDARDVRLAAMVSEGLAGTRTHLVHTVVLSGGSTDGGGLGRLVSARPDVVFVAASGSRALEVIRELRLHGGCPGIVLAEPPVEGSPRGFEARVLDGVYVQSDFIEGTVTSPGGRYFLSYCRSHRGHGGSPGVLEATGAESYLLAVELISGAERRGLEAALRDAAARQSVLLAAGCARCEGSKPERFQFGRYERRFTGEASLEAVAALEIGPSDPVAYVGTQELFGHHGEVGPVDALLDLVFDIPDLVHAHVGCVHDRPVDVLHELDRSGDVHAVERGLVPVL